MTVARSSYKKHMNSDTHLKAFRLHEERRDSAQADEGGQSSASASGGHSSESQSQPVELRPSIINTDIASPDHDNGDPWLNENSVDETELFGSTLYYNGIYHDDIGNPIHFSAGSSSLPSAQQDKLLEKQLDTYGILNADEDGQRFHSGVDMEDFLGEEDELEDTTKTNVEALTPDCDSGERFKIFQEIASNVFVAENEDDEIEFLMQSAGLCRKKDPNEAWFPHGSKTVRFMSFSQL